MALRQALSKKVGWRPIKTMSNAPGAYVLYAAGLPLALIGLRRKATLLLTYGFIRLTFIINGGLFLFGVHLIILQSDSG